MKSAIRRKLDMGDVLLPLGFKLIRLCSFELPGGDLFKYAACDMNSSNIGAASLT
jgi:hypothetical protein